MYIYFLEILQSPTLCASFFRVYWSIRKLSAFLLTAMNRCRYCKVSILRQTLVSSNTSLGALQPPLISQLRCGSNFINSKTAAQLWQGVTPHDQKKHTGGKRLIKKAVKDLNLGRPVGTGKLGIHWPGLNAPVKIQHYNENLKDAFESG